MVLERLLENQLFTKAEICKFHSCPVAFLGFIFESWQIRADPELSDDERPGDQHSDSPATSSNKDPLFWVNLLVKKRITYIATLLSFKL